MVCELGLQLTQLLPGEGCPLLAGLGLQLFAGLLQVWERGRPRAGGRIFPSSHPLQG